MATTRTSEPGPGGIATPSYGSTAPAEHRHKHRLYASSRLARCLQTGALLALFPPGPAAAAPPCAPCLRVSVTPSQALATTAPLNGASVFVRVPAASVSDAPDALRHLSDHGARSGLHLVGIPPDPTRALAGPFEQLVVEAAGEQDAAAIASLKETLATARGLHPSAPLFVALPEAATEAADALRPYVDAVLPPPAPLGDLGGALMADDGRVHVVTANADGVLAALGRAQAILPRDLAPVAGRRIRCGDRSLETYVDPATLALVALGSCASAADVRSDVPGAPVEIVSIGSLNAVRLADVSGERFQENVAIAATRRLSVEEIVARHQAFAARQSAGISRRISTAAFMLTFEAPGFPAPVTVTARTVFYIRPGRTDLQQRDLRVNGVAFDAGGGVPRLPIIEPERVAAPPLTITLDELYRYELTGEATLRGRRCYAVRFTPIASAPLAAGDAWIDEQTFALVRVHAVQTALRGPITASEQTDDYAADAGGRWLPSRTEVHQTYEGASFRTPIHRLLVFESHSVDPADFEERLNAAYASSDVMLRETPEGFRYLRRTSTAGAQAAKAPGPPARIESARVDRIRTLAMGVLIDPNISRPLPFAGLSYADFNLFNRGGQLDGFFAGTYAQAAFAWPSVGRSRWHAAGRAFGIAVSYNDRAFEGGREQYALDIRQRPASAALAMLHPLGARTTFRAQYEFDYVAYARGDATAPDFRLPVNQQVHGLRLEIDRQQGRWQTSVWWSGSRRIGWKAWGPPGGEYRPSQSDFQRFGVDALRTVAISPRLSTRFEVGLTGGLDLDRFSRFAFGTFDNRLHGYPSALVRYDRGGVLRTAIAWSASHGFRVDGFADTAQVRDPGFGRGLRNYTGLGAAAELPAPWHTLAAVEWGYGVQALNSAGGRGTQVVRITAYKVF